MTDWVGIETPPRDVGEYIVAVSGRARIAFSDGEGRFWNPETGDREVQYYDDATHWTTLPTPPNIDKGE